MNDVIKKSFHGAIEDKAGLSRAHPDPKADKVYTAMLAAVDALDEATQVALTAQRPKFDDLEDLYKEVMGLQDKFRKRYYHLSGQADPAVYAYADVWNRTNRVIANTMGCYRARNVALPQTQQKQLLT